MLLCLDIGNSNVTMGLFREGDDRPFYRGKISAKTARSADEYAIVIANLLNLSHTATDQITGCVIGSVVPPLTGLLQTALERLELPPVLTVGPGVKTGFGIRIADPSELGADLAANTAAALAVYGAPLILIDAGTATTISLIDEEKFYRGACILPGLRSGVDVLKESTALLPTVSLNPLSKEDGVIGTHTAECIEKGLLWGNAILVDGFIDKYSQLLSKEPTVVATGGSAKLFLDGCSHKVHYDPDLTLKGLRVIYQLSRKKRK